MLWTLVESETVGLEWQPALSEMELLLQEKLNAHLEAQTSESAVILADYLTERIQGDKAWFEFEGTRYGWHPERNRWVEVTPENETEIDWSLDTAFADVIAPSWITEDGQFAYIDREGQEVVVPNQAFPYIGEVSLPELILMGQEQELVYDGQTGLSLMEYFELLVVNCDHPYKSDLMDRMVEWAKDGGFVMAGVLDQGFKKERGRDEKSFFLSKQGDRIGRGPAVANDVLRPIVFRGEDGKVKVVASVRILQEIAYTGFLQQLKIAGSGDSVEVVSDGILG